MNTRKSDLVLDASKATGISKTDCRATFKQFCALLSENLAAGNAIEFRGFGTFSVRTHKARPARNPRTGEIIQLPECKVAKLKYSPVIKL